MDQTTANGPPPRRIDFQAADKVALVLIKLREGRTIYRAEIRAVGKVAESLGMTRRSKEPYDEFLGRMLRELTKEVDQ